MRTIKPTGAHLLVEEIPTEHQGLIAIPETARHPHDDSARLYRVLDRGRKVDEEIVVGDRVLCHSHMAGPVSMEGDSEDKRKIITDDHVILVFKRPLSSLEPQAA